jgi:hypothetical protein
VDNSGGGELPGGGGCLACRRCRCVLPAAPSTLRPTRSKTPSTFWLIIVDPAGAGDAKLFNLFVNNRRALMQLALRSTLGGWVLRPPGCRQR